MKNIIIAGAVFVAIIVALVISWQVTSCDAADQTCNAASEKRTNVSRSDAILDEILNGTAQLIDVREPEEYAEGHVENSLLIPLGDIESGELDFIDKDKKIYIYCRSGRRAEIAKTILQNQGYENVENIGGLTDWQGMGGIITQ
jgi:phage shock protein E